MDGAQVGILKKADDVRFRCLLQRKQRLGLEPGFFRFEIYVLKFVERDSFLFCIQSHVVFLVLLKSLNEKVSWSSVPKLVCSVVSCHDLPHQPLEGEFPQQQFGGFLVLFNLPNGGLTGLRLPLFGGESRSLHVF